MNKWYDQIPGQVSAAMRVAAIEVKAPYVEAQYIDVQQPYLYARLTGGKTISLQLALNDQGAPFLNLATRSAVLHARDENSDIADLLLPIRINLSGDISESFQRRAKTVILEFFQNIA